jgi:pimeloyl-ACP methyl ester carboxylesterase
MPFANNRGVRLLDVRGHGASDKPRDPDAYGLDQYATDVIAVMEELDIDRVDYFGYSLGGWTGYGLAMHACDRLRSLTIGGAHPYGQSLAVYRDMLKDDLNSCLAFLEAAAGDPLPEEGRKEFFSNDLQALRAAYLRDRLDISAVMPTMTVPCLLFAGESDPLHPAVRRCANELPRATYFSVSGSNHVQAALHLKRVPPHLIRFLADAHNKQDDDQA